MARLSDFFALIRNGVNIKQGLDDSGYPITRIETISNRTVDRNKMGYAGINDLSKYRDYILQDGDILMSHINSEKHLAKTALYQKNDGEEVIHGMNLLLLRPNTDCVISKYAFYYFSSQSFLRQIPNITKKSVNQASFTVSALKELSFPSVSLNDQLKIVGILEKIDTLIEMRKQQLAKLDELVKARFVEMFGDYDLSHIQDEWKSISQIGKVVGGATPKTNVVEYWDGEYRWITPAELDSDSGYIYDSVRKLTKTGVESCSLQEMPVNTVILSSRAPIGKVAIAGKTFYCNQGFKNIICNGEILPRYLYTVLLLNTEYLNSLGRGATFKEISKSIVENIKIPVPSIELQKQFTTFVEQVDKSKVAVQKALDETQTLFDSLMQQYFG